MNLENLFRIQKELDRKIVNEHQLNDQDLTRFKLLALQVELGELANETRCFKYWSLKPPSEQTVILEEYVDCLHFILSLGLDKGVTGAELEFKTSDLGLTEQFQALFSLVEAFGQSPDSKSYDKLWQQFLFLGHSLGFSLDKIEEAYLHKNRINHRRQEEGY